jgi:chromosome segregation ATPase
MADNPTTEQINAQNESIQNLTKTQANYREETSRTTKETEAFYKKSVRGLANVVRSATGLKNALKPTIREVDALSTAVGDVNTATLALAKTQKMAAREGKIQTLAHIQDIKGVLKSYEATTIQMQKLNAELNNSTAQYKKTSEELDAVKVSIANLEKAKKKGTITTEEYDREIKKLNDDAKALDDTLENLNGQIEVAANMYAKKQKQLLADRKNTIESARASREANREVRMQTGGMGAFRAALEGVVDSKFWDMAERWSKGGLFLIGLKEMYDALNGAAKHMGSIAKLSNQIDVSLGRAG